MRSKGRENNTGGKETITQRKGEERSLESRIKRGREKRKNTMASEDERKKNHRRKTLRWKEGNDRRTV